MMSKEANIDEVFKSKLAGRCASGNPELARNGARALLDQHYRALFWKRVLIGLVSLVSISGLSVFALLQESNTDLEQASKPVLTETPTAIHKDAYPNNQDMAIATNSAGGQDLEEKLKDSTIPASSIQEEDLSESQQNIASSASTTSNNANPISSSEATTETTESARIEDSKTIIGTERTSQGASMSNNLERFTRLDDNKIVNTKSFIDLMPSYAIGLMRNETAGITERGLSKKEALMAEARKVDVFIEAGGLLNNGLQNQAPQQSRIGGGWYGGITAQYNFHSRFYARTGAIFHNRGRLESNKLIGLSFENGLVEERAGRVSYVDIPFQFGYRRFRHHVHFGMSFSPLVGYSSTWVTNGNGSSNESLEEPQSGLKRDGFAGFDVAASAGYTFQITDRWNGMVSFRYGLFDITDNAYYQTNIVDDRNHQLRVGLRYRVLSR